MTESQTTIRDSRRKRFVWNDRDVTTNVKKKKTSFKGKRIFKKRQGDD